MRVNPNSEPLGVTGSPNRASARVPRLDNDETTLVSAQRMDTALAQTPAVRAEKVAEAQKLVRDVSYPPEELINQLSALLASHFDSTNQSG